MQSHCPNAALSSHMTVVPNFGLARRCEEPFRHTWIPRLYPKNSNDRILEWLEQDHPWEFTETSFYQQFEFSLKDISPPADLEFVAAKDTLSAIGIWLEKTFDVPKLESVDVVAHLLERGHGIGVHNDYQKDGEILRLLLQLSRNVEGGITALCRNGCRDSVQRIIKPVHGTAIAFAISSASYHAVSKVRNGQRFTLVYSFRPR